MKIFDIQGKLINVDIRRTSYPLKGISKSKIQGLVSEVIQELYPAKLLLEEFTVPGSRLSVDFFLPKDRIVIEVQGEQHETFSPFFHGNKATSVKFAKQVQNDRAKHEWAELNNFEVIEIEYGTDREQIRSILIAAIGSN